MLTIDTYLGPDEYGGRAAFASAPVKKGDIVWRYDERSTRIITLQEYRTMLSADDNLAKTLKTYCYPCDLEEDGVMQRVLCHDLDNGSFMNHSDTPNTGYITDPMHPYIHEQDEVNIALRDIAAGEQLTFNYYSFVADWTQWTDVETCMQFLFDMREAAMKRAS